MLSQSGMLPRGGNETPGRDGQSERLGLGVGSLGGVGVGGMQGTLGVADGVTLGHGNGDSVGVASFGGVGVGMQLGSGRLGSDGSTGPLWAVLGAPGCGPLL